MTFDEKKNQIAVVEDIGRLIDAEGTLDERAKILESLEATKDGAELLKQLSSDQRLLQDAVLAEMPQTSFDRLSAVIDQEFERREPRSAAHFNWSQAVIRLAASLVLVAGTFAATNYWMQSRLDQTVANIAAHMETERILLAQTVQDALETKVSGEPIHIGQEGDWSDVLTPIKTYKSKSGHWCRQYLRETSIGKMDLTIQGTACRDENGIWTTVFAEPVTDNFSPQTPGI